MRSRGLTNIVLPGPSKGRPRASRLHTLQLLVVQPLTLVTTRSLTRVFPSVLQIVLQSAAGRRALPRVYTGTRIPIGFPASSHPYRGAVGRASAGSCVKRGAPPDAVGA